MIESLTRSTSLYLHRRRSARGTVFLLGARLRSPESSRVRLFFYTRCVQTGTFFTKATSDNRHRYGTSTAVCIILVSCHDKYPLSRFRSKHKSCLTSLIIRFCYGSYFFLSYWTNDRFYRNSIYLFRSLKQICVFAYKKTLP